MIFWDTSALLPLLVQEPSTVASRELLRGDSVLAVWWGASVEAASAVARREREGTLAPREADRVRASLGQLARSWVEVLPTDEVRGHATRLLLRHPLRAADALQLAAALTLVRGAPTADLPFACLDARLAAAARAEGFRLAHGLL